MLSEQTKSKTNKYLNKGAKLISTSYIIFVSFDLQQVFRLYMSLQTNGINITHYHITVSVSVYF